MTSSPAPPGAPPPTPHPPPHSLFTVPASLSPSLPGARARRPPTAAAPLMPRRSGLASGLLLGSALDALFADPRRGHPVAAFGTAAARAEGRLWAASRARGTLFAVTCAGPAVAAGWAAQRLAGRRPLPGAALAAAATWAVLGGASLATEAAGVSRTLAADDLDDARRRLPRAVRPPRPRRAARSRTGPRGRRVGGGEHLRRGGRATAVGRGGQRGRPARLPGGEHARRDGRSS